MAQKITRITRFAKPQKPRWTTIQLCSSYQSSKNIYNKLVRGTNSCTLHVNLSRWNFHQAKLSFVCPSTEFCVNKLGRPSLGNSLEIFLEFISICIVKSVSVSVSASTTATASAFVSLYLYLCGTRTSNKLVSPGHDSVSKQKGLKTNRKWAMTTSEDLFFQFSVCWLLFSSILLCFFFGLLLFLHWVYLRFDPTTVCWPKKKQNKTKLMKRLRCGQRCLALIWIVMDCCVYVNDYEMCR